MAEGPRAGDERAHSPGPPALWAESWDFDYAAEDGSLGGYVRLGVYPNLRLAWYWAALVGTDRPLVAVRDHDVAVPRRSMLEVRAEGLWSALNCETPHDHWSVGLEAFAVAMDDPTEAWGDERGERTALGLDLEWEASAPVVVDGGAVGPSAGRYQQACSVYGDVLVGDERLDFSGWGRREHWWGIQDWWTARPAPSISASGRLNDGRAFAVGPGGRYVARPDGSGVQRSVGPVAMETAADGRGLPISAAIVLGDMELAATPLGHAPVLVVGPGARTSRLARALCRYEATPGVVGVGWAEWLGLLPDVR